MRGDVAFWVELEYGLNKRVWVLTCVLGTRSMGGENIARLNQSRKRSYERLIEVNDSK